MMESSVEAGPWRIHVWEEASGDLPSQDASLIERRPDGLRLAAIDGATPTRRTPETLGLDGAVSAAEVIRTALRAPDPAGRSLERAHDYLFDPSLNHRDRPQAMVTVAELSDRGDAAFFRCGDCEVWVRTGTSWEPAFPGEVLTPAGRASYQAWLVQHPRPSREELFSAEQDLLDEQSWQAAPPVGRFPAFRIDGPVTTGFDELVLASDGARLDSERLGELGGWLARLRDYERSECQHEAKPHDDVTVVRVLHPG